MKDQAEIIKELRKETGAPILDCKKVLAECGGDHNKAKSILREKGFAAVQKMEGRSTNQGIIAAYVHHDCKTGVLIELDCETDFVARNEIFRDLAKEISLQIAACAPVYISRENIKDEDLAKVPEDERDEFVLRNCLFEQATIRDSKVTVKDLLTQAKSKLGENIVLKRFIRYKVGEQ